MNYLSYAASKGYILGNQQREILSTFELENVAVANGHSVGVSHVMAIALAYHLEVETDTTVLIGGVNSASVYCLINQASIIAGKDFSKSDKTLAFTNDSGLSGRKVNGKLVALVNDGDEIKSEIASALQGLLISPEHKIFVAGNPVSENDSLLKIAFAPDNIYFQKFNLSALDHENVIKTNHYQFVRPIEGNGLNYAWVKDKLDNWCVATKEDDTNPDVFIFKGKYYIPNAEFKARVMGQWS